jgi:hypothetical protein
VNVLELLRAALALLDEPVEDTATVWPLGAAVLTRQAIEATADAFWAKTVPAMQHATRREQWLALPSYLGRMPELRAAEYAWSALSDACHHREYDVGLTEPELRAHLRAADDFRTAVGAKIQARAKTRVETAASTADS